ncbi:hypothetical protein ACJMK2_044458 [Sinanodonta woodiana]|uniref:Chitin-binding type-2 domain-containing protein n=1 Tax=Sinanodonta woodiana TaxID=1069815 RepID=A0ABD3W057_SINWO
MNFKWITIFVVILYADQNFVTEGRCTNGEVSPDLLDKTCKRYFLCSSGFLVGQQCPNNYVFSKTTRTCVPISSPYNDCNNFTTRRPKITTTYKVRPRCKEGETRPNPQDCKSFYICSFNTWIPKVCPPRYVYSQTAGKCVFSPSPYECSKPITISTTTPVYPTTKYRTTTYTYRTCKEGERRAHNRDCKLYFICIGNVWSLRTCPKHGVFSTTVGKCVPSYSPYDYCSRTTYKMTTTTPVYFSLVTTTTSWTTIPKYPPKCKEGETRPHRYDCRSYYICRNNVWIHKECPHRHVYSKIVGKCVMLYSPYDYCSRPDNRMTTTPLYTTTIRKPRPKCKEGETRPHPQDCKSYYVCYYYAWVPKVCPHRNVYSKIVGKCVMSHSPFDDCSQTPNERITSTTEFPDYIIPDPSSTESCISGETYPVQNNCYRYFYCNNGTLQQRTCVFDFVYSRRMRRCVPQHS